MNDFNFQDIMQNLAGNGITANVAALIAIGVLGLLVAAYLVIKFSRGKQTPPPVAAPARKAPPKVEPVISEAPKPAATIQARKPATPAPEPAATQPTEAIQTRQPAPAAAPAPKATVAQRPAAPAFGRHVPRDSVLNRHFQAHICHMLEAVAAPRPADSVLKRHHEHLLRSRLQACLRDKACLDKLTAEYEACRANKAAAVAATPAPAPAVATPPPAAAPAPVAVAAAVPAPSQPAESVPAAVRIPQDSILRRHFLNHLAYMLEAIAPCRPTDSVLKRHHAQWLRIQLDACLSDPARLNKVLSDYESGRIAKA